MLCRKKVIFYICRISLDKVIVVKVHKHSSGLNSKVKIMFFFFQIKPNYLYINFLLYQPSTGFINKNNNVRKQKNVRFCVLVIERNHLRSGNFLIVIITR